MIVSVGRCQISPHMFPQHAAQLSTLQLCLSLLPPLSLPAFTKPSQTFFLLLLPFFLMVLLVGGWFVLYVSSCPSSGLNDADIPAQFELLLFGGFKRHEIFEKAVCCFQFPHCQKRKKEKKRKTFYPLPPRMSGDKLAVRAASGQSVTHHKVARQQ